MDFLVRSHTSQGALIDLLPVPQDVVLSRVCRALSEAGVRNMDFISSYIDSLVSYGQLQTWVEDIPRFLDNAELSSDEVGVVREMLRLVHDAVRLGGYLYIEGETFFNIYTEIRHQEPDLAVPESTTRTQQKGEFSRTQLEDLPEISVWSSGWKPTPTVLDFLSQNVSVAKALSVLRLVWPEFLEIRGCVLLSSRYSESAFESWWETLGGDCARIEQVINHVHLWDVFAPTLSGDNSTDGPALEELAHVMCRTFRAALLERFPGREFEVVATDDPEDYGPTVTFWSVRS